MTSQVCLMPTGKRYDVRSAQLHELPESGHIALQVIATYFLRTFSQNVTNKSLNIQIDVLSGGQNVRRFFINDNND